jgi:hypothetical protein
MFDRDRERLQSSGIHLESQPFDNEQQLRWIDEKTPYCRPKEGHLKSGSLTAHSATLRMM